MTVRDNGGGMSSTARSSDAGHPLLADRALLDEILTVIYAEIHKVLKWPDPGLRRGAWHLGGAAGPERTLEGTGVSADDILSEVFWALIQYQPERLQGSWQGLAIGIARNKTKNALRAAGKGLRGTDHRPELRLVSGDARMPGSDGELGAAIFDVLPTDWGSLEEEYLALAGVLDLRDLALKVLDDREQRIFFAIHFSGYTRKEVGEQLGLTGARIGQIYNASLRRLKVEPPLPRPVTREDDKRRGGN